MATPRAKPSPPKSPPRKPAAVRTPSPKLPAPRPSAALPSELAERTKAQHAAHIRERQTDIAANLVDIGLSLVELKADGMAEALGRTGFAEVCEKDLRMAVSTANGLIAIATKMPRERVTALRAERARAVLALVEATPEDDTAADVLHAKLALPSGRTLDVAQATAKDSREAARELRAARADSGACVVSGALPSRRCARASC